MKRSVTGGSGLIDSHDVDRCLARRFVMVIFDNYCGDFEPGARFYQLDRCGPALHRVFEKERIF